MNYTSKTLYNYGLLTSIRLDTEKYLFGYNSCTSKIKVNNNTYSKDEYNILNTKLKESDNSEINEINDYIKNSIYKAFLACDSVSREILLSHHYRCNRQIIQFNNKKYYNGKLQICSQSSAENSLVFRDITGNSTYYKNKWRKNNITVYN